MGVDGGFVKGDRVRVSFVGTVVDTGPFYVRVRPEDDGLAERDFPVEWVRHEMSDAAVDALVEDVMKPYRALTPDAIERLIQGAGRLSAPPDPDTVPRIVTYGSVMVETVDGWVLIEHSTDDAAPAEDLAAPSDPPLVAITNEQYAVPTRRPYSDAFPTAEAPRGPIKYAGSWVPSTGDRVVHTEYTHRGAGTVHSVKHELDGVADYATVVWDNGQCSDSKVYNLLPCPNPVDDRFDPPTEPWVPQKGDRVQYLTEPDLQGVIDSLIGGRAEVTWNSGAGTSCATSMLRPLPHPEPTVVPKALRTGDRVGLIGSPATGTVISVSPDDAFVHWDHHTDDIAATPHLLVALRFISRPEPETPLFDPTPYEHPNQKSYDAILDHYRKLFPDARIVRHSRHPDPGVEFPWKTVVFPTPTNQLGAGGPLESVEFTFVGEDHDLRDLAEWAANLVNAIGQATPDTAWKVGRPSSHRGRTTLPITEDR